MRFVHRRAEGGQHFRRKADRIQPQGLGRGVQDAGDDVFAKAGGEAGHAQGDLAPADDEAGAAVLRLVLFGQVQVRQNFHAGDDGGLHGLGDEHILVQHAIHAGANPHHVLFRLKMNVAGAVVDGAGDDLAHHADDGRVFILVGHPAERLVQRPAGLALFFVQNLVDGGADAVAGVVMHFQAVENVLLAGGDDVDVFAGNLLEEIHGHDIKGVGHGHGQGAVLALDGDGQAAARHIPRHQFKNRFGDGDAVQMDHGGARLFAQEMREGLRRHEAELHENLPQPAAAALLLAPGQLKLLGGERARLHELFPKCAGLLDHRFKLTRRTPGHGRPPCDVITW